MKLTSPMTGVAHMVDFGRRGRALTKIALMAAVVTVAGSLSFTAFAAGGATVTAATGGTAMIATNAGPSATYTSLTGPKVVENTEGDVSTGRFQLVAPAGFEFATSAVTVAASATGQSPRLNPGPCGTGNSSSISVTPTAAAITFNVCAVGNHAATYQFTGVKVRPTASSPLAANGHIYLDGTSGAVAIVGVSAGTSGTTGTSFGDLVEKPGPTSQLAVSGLPGSVTAGTSQSVVVSAADVFGNITPTYTGTVHFTSTDPAATVPANYTFVSGDNGSHTFTSGVTLKTAGNRSVTVTDTAAGSVTGVASTTVNAAAATSMALTGIANPTTAGASTSATVTLRDTYNNLASGYTGTVHFTSTDTAATLPSNYTFVAGDAGTHTFTNGIVLRTAGNQGVTASDGTRSATQTPITVQPGVLDHLVLSPATSTTTAGTSRTFTASGRDANNNNLGDVTATTTFTITPNGSCAANSCGATVAGTHTVTGTKSGATGTAALQINPGTAQVGVSLTPSTLVANGTSTATVVVNAADQYGNARSGDPVTVATDGDATLSAVHDNGDGTYTATLTSSTRAGTQTITATDGMATGSALLTEAAGPASQVTLTLSPATLEADGTSTSNATITVADAQGNPRSDDPVTLTTNGDVTISNVTSQGFGTYTATITASTTGDIETITAADGTATATAQLVERTPVNVTGVSPASRGQGANGGAFGQSIALTGSGFTPGALADFGAGVTVKFTTYVDATHLTAHIAVASNASVGNRSVTVTVSDGRSSACADCFTVVAGPTVTDVTPNDLGPGAVKTATITGSGFSAGVKVTVPGNGVAVTSVSVVDSGHLSVGLSTAALAAPGPRDLIVSNPSDAGSTTCTACLTITVAPVVSDISPSTLGGSAQTSVTVSGANFVSGAKLSFAGTGVAVLSQTFVDGTDLTATLSLAGSATPGARTVTVINPDGGKGYCATCFSVDAAPTVSGMTPGTLSRGATADVTITGTNFVPASSLTLGSGLTVSDVVVTDANTITATVSVAATTGTGNRTVVVTNPDFGKGTCTTCLRVVL
jgi:hypothetical protein